MLFLLSPAKTLDFDNAAFTDAYTEPRLLDESEKLVERARDLDANDIKALMGVSDNIAALNVERFNAWRRPFDMKTAKQAAFAFKGDVYTGLNIETCDEKQVDYLQHHVRILSGLYGVLRPLDLMQPYRLEMGIKFETEGARNLYEFWGEKITALINGDLDGDESVVINLASNEYFKSVDKKLLKGRLITPVFKDLKGDKYKIISFYAKKARGLMVRYACDKGISDPEQLKGFDYEGYVFSDEQSDSDTWVFTRDTAPKSK